MLKDKVNPETKKMDNREKKIKRENQSRSSRRQLTEIPKKERTEKIKEGKLSEKQYKKLSRT